MSGGVTQGVGRSSEIKRESANFGFSYANPILVRSF